VGNDGAPQAPAPGLQGRDALEEGLLDDAGARAGAGLLEAALLAPKVGLDVVESRHKRLEVGDGLGRGLPSLRAHQLAVAGQEPRVDPVLPRMPKPLAKLRTRAGLTTDTRIPSAASWWAAGSW
jgi:hypothetical protein